MKAVLFLLLVISTAAFEAQRSPGKTIIRSSRTLNAKSVSTLNGWTPDEKYFAWGLPGVIAPFEEGFDPFGLSNKITLDEIKRYREAEVTHGRVAMLATLGFLVGERFHPLFNAGNEEILGIYSLGYVRQVLPTFFEVLAISIGILELGRALTGWRSPAKRGPGGNEGDWLNEDYYPGDIGFDPLGFKPVGAVEFEKMQTKELQNGRLAMLGIAGFVAQELVEPTPVLQYTFGI